MKKKLLVLVTFLTMAGVIASVAYAAPPKPGQGMGSHLPIGKLLDDPEFIEKLQLSSDQVAKLKNLHFEHQKRMIALRSNLQTKKLELRQLFDAEVLDKKLIRTKVEEVNTAKANLALEKVEMKLSAIDVFTSEQMAELKKMKRKFEGRKRIKRMEMEGPKGKYERRMRIHKHCPKWHDIPVEEEIEREIYIEEEE